MEDLARIAISHMTKLGAEFADLRIERSTGTNIVVMDGKTKTLTAMQESGCGLRAFIGGAWGFATTNDLTVKSVKTIGEAAVKMARAAKARAKHSFVIEQGKALKVTEEYKCKVKPSDVSVEEKHRFALGCDRSMRDADPRVSSTNSRYDDTETDRVVSNSFGTMVRTRERWVLGACSAWAKSEGVIQRGHEAVGSVGGYELMKTEDANSMGQKASAQALRLLDSKPAPAGKFTCILDNTMTGVLAHEAFGHACEADLVLAGASILEDKLGKRVAGEEVTLVDDPTVRNTFGYFSTDWEGVRTKKHVLIEDGILVGFLHNIESSNRMAVEPNGAARAQVYNNSPIVRMSNTYIAPGDRSKGELFSELKQGLLFQGMQYGYVEPAKGQFMFKCDEAYDVKNGEVGQRYRDASLSGVILEVLTKVEALADDFRLVDPGYCGKGAQSARTTDGGPHMTIRDLVVGGLA